MTYRKTITEPSGSSVRCDIVLFEGIVLVGLALMMLFSVVRLGGPAGLGLFGGGPPTVEAVVRTDDGADLPGEERALLESIQINLDVTPGASNEVHIGAPITATVEMPNASASSRVIWLARELAGPLLVAGVLWLVLGVVRSVRRGDPFTAANERRLWALSALIAIGGTIMSMLTGFVDMLLVQRSPAADLFEIGVDLSFVPIVVGGGVAVLAAVWRHGVQLRDDVDGMV